MKIFEKLIKVFISVLFSIRPYMNYKFGVLQKSFLVFFVMLIFCDEKCKGGNQQYTVYLENKFTIFLFLIEIINFCYKKVY